MLSVHGVWTASLFVATCYPMQFTLRSKWHGMDTEIGVAAVTVTRVHTTAPTDKKKTIEKMPLTKNNSRLTMAGYVTFKSREYLTQKRQTWLVRQPATVYKQNGPQKKSPRMLMIYTFPDCMYPILPSFFFLSVPPSHVRLERRDCMTWFLLFVLFWGYLFT